MQDGRIERRDAAWWAAAASWWLLLLSIGLVITRSIVPSDGLGATQLGGAIVDGGFEVSGGPDVDGIGVGDRVVAIDGRSIDDLLRNPDFKASTAGEVRTYLIERADGTASAVSVTLRNARDLVERESDNGWPLISLFALLALGVWFRRKVPHEPASAFLLLMAACLCSIELSSIGTLEPLDLDGRPWLVAWSIAAAAGFAVLPVAALLLVLSLPGDATARPVRISRAIVVFPPTSVAALGTFVATIGASSRTVEVVDVAIGVWFLTVLLATLVTLAVSIWRARADPIGRRRLQLVGIGALVTFGLIVMINLTSLDLPIALFGVMFVPLVLALGVAIVRHDLFDLDLAVNRALVALVSGSVLLAIYGTAVALTVAIAGQAGPGSGLVGAGIVAVAFAPLRDRVRRWVDHRLHGSSSDPVLVVRELGLRLSRASDPEALVTAVVETVSDGLRVPYVALEVRTRDGWAPAEERGARSSNLETFEIRSGDELVARLVVAPHRDTGRLAASEREILQDLARHGGVTMQVAALVAELRSAQRRVVVAREAERHRISRDLHDGLGPILFGLSLQLEVAAEAAVESGADPRLAEKLQRLGMESSRATESVRRIVRDLRPLELDEVGLVTAVIAAANRLQVDGGPTISVRAPSQLTVATAVEDVAYPICVEALTNVVRHSGATECSVEIGLTADRHLRLAVSDNGCGMNGETVAGNGIASMRERATVLGGSFEMCSANEGTVLVVTLPIDGLVGT